MHKPWHGANTGQKSVNLGRGAAGGVAKGNARIVQAGTAMSALGMAERGEAGFSPDTEVRQGSGHMQMPSLDPSR